MYGNLLYHIFSGKYSSFEYLIKCQMPTLYHTPTFYHTPTLYRTPTLYTLLFKYMIKCINMAKSVWYAVSSSTNIIPRA
jgi:hypothetical protein